ncbi:hypothetical protein COT63_00685 [Candidatus Shapirobacteria bacterium CG09_land_8_20_14_0_10_38_17]|uniref:Glycosyltransferase 2-like domain-containing protein n=1 Tax=Candidatus Shapirobacteria bacterium CG09_land_8_20_14_0_10_38_17 TaxID=1974884 RepID=A0A2H0WRI5_9BACT|nr:MAG: hypothetical protein COT63_00685 [Candidatus Shapirobacteria bacterium CG09_land_8_20_14_0_10_38_17]
MKKNKEISIIIPNWNGEKQLQKNLPLLFNVLAKFEGKSEIIIVDDKSRDGSRKYLKQLTIKSPKLKVKNSQKQTPTKPSIPHLRIILNKENVGFARSVNKGVKAAQYNVVFLLNTDVVVKKGCFEAILSHFDEPDVFAVGANADWQLGIVSFKGGFFDISQPLKISRNTTKAQNSSWVSGGHSAFRKSIWQELGGIDILFSPFYFEETDLCYRAWKRGYRVLWEPKSRVDHRHEESVIRQNFSPDYINFIAQRNQLFFIWKNLHDPKMFKEHCFNLMRRLLKHPKYFRVFFAACRRLPQVLVKRKIEKQVAILSDKEVFEKISRRSER